MGSISGGGRYDNLTGIFGMPGLSGVGISFGVDRIYDVLDALQLYPLGSLMTSRVLFINFGQKEAAYCMSALAQVRQAGIRAELFPDASKMKKQMSYANAKQIPYVVLAGDNEMAQGKLTLKDMATSDQKLVTTEELIEELKK
jgi:histidyl-tRNA synthetase